VVHTAQLAYERAPEAGGLAASESGHARDHVGVLPCWPGAVLRLTLICRGI
jgi:hypothetical protein